MQGVRRHAETTIESAHASCSLRQPRPLWSQSMSDDDQYETTGVMPARTATLSCAR